ncbi:MAG: hypothetical protein KAG61_13925 [Bacteriovoracaceae bacterium]|nr:hypothetical protein [Bacteriovoracaceae bacterium]
MEIEVLFQDDHYIVVNKPSGMLVHPYKSQSNERTHLMKYVKEQTGLYLYPIHRIDRPVSGIVIFALSSKAASSIQEIWSTDSVVKEYLCLARRQIHQEGTYTFDLTNDNGVKQHATTHYTPLEVYSDCTFILVKIKTGRKHQIRRHFSRRCHNLVGDTKYGKGDINRKFRDEYKLSRIFLHAAKTSFVHPFTEENIEIVCPLPIELSSIIEKLSSQLGHNLSE